MYHVTATECDVSKLYWVLFFFDITQNAFPERIDKKETK